MSLAGNKMTTSQKATKAGEKDVTVVSFFSFSFGPIFSGSVLVVSYDEKIFD